jgi:hypothetical protein
MPYTSSAFSQILKNKGLDNLESINEATKRLLKTGELLLVKRDKRWFYIQPSELRDNDIIRNLIQK